MRVIFRVFVRVVVVFGIFIGLVLALLTITEYRPDDIEVLTIENNGNATLEIGSSLTLMTFNIGYAGLGEDEDFILDGGSKARPNSLEVVEGYFDGILDVLKTHSADIYLLQEVDLRARRSYNLNQVDLIHDHLGNDFSSTFAYNFKAVFVPFPISFTDYIGPVESGLQTLSRYQIESSERHQFPGSFSWPLRVANLKRAMLISRFEVENTDKELVIVNLHMSAYDSDGSLREAEMAYLRAFMEAEYALGNFVIIGGDFNQTFPSVVDNEVTRMRIPEDDDAYYVAFPIEDSFLPNGFVYAIDETLPTCRLLNQSYNPGSEGTQYYIIDGFMVSDNIQVDNVYTVDHGFAYSDHNPVMLEITLLLE